MGLSAERARIVSPHRVLGWVPNQHSLGSPAKYTAKFQHVARTEEMVDLRKLAGQLSRVPLREAAGDHELLAGAGFLVAAHLEDRLDRFLLRGPDEATSVDDDHLRGRRVIHDFEARLPAHPEHDLGVHAVLRAAERDEMNGPGVPHWA